MLGRQHGLPYLGPEKRRTNGLCSRPALYPKAFGGRQLLLCGHRRDQRQLAQGGTLDAARPDHQQRLHAVGERHSALANHGAWELMLWEIKPIVEQVAVDSAEASASELPPVAGVRADSQAFRRQPDVVGRGARVPDDSIQRVPETLVETGALHQDRNLLRRARKGRSRRWQRGAPIEVRGDASDGVLAGGGIQGANAGSVVASPAQTLGAAGFTVVAVAAEHGRFLPRST